MFDIDFFAGVYNDNQSGLDYMDYLQLSIHNLSTGKPYWIFRCIL